MSIFTDARPNIFHTAMFRSGSTHIKSTMMRLLPEYHVATSSMCAGGLGDDNLQMIDIYAAAVLFRAPETYFHQHTLGTSGNVALLKQYGLNPIVQFRNMLDSMVSLHGILNEGQQGLGFYIPSDWDDMSKKRQLWWLVKNISRWYFVFYLSWMEADISTLQIWYDDYYKDQVAGVRRILDHTGLSALGTVTDEAIKKASETIDIHSRFKFGRPGRGREILSEEMIADITAQALTWTKGPEMVKELILR